MRKEEHGYLESIEKTPPWVGRGRSHTGTKCQVYLPTSVCNPQTSLLTSHYPLVTSRALDIQKC